MAFARTALIAFVLSPALMFAQGLNYGVEIEGVESSSALKAIKQVSNLITLRRKPPSSINALRYRANSDIPLIRKILRSEGYFEPKIQINIEEWNYEAIVYIQIDEGPRYSLSEYSVDLQSDLLSDDASIPHFKPSQVGIEIGKPALAGQILESENTLLDHLSQMGYPLAKVDEREVIVDGKSKTVSVNEHVNIGARCRFGPSTLTGYKRVKPRLIEKHIKWKEGEVFDKSKIEATQKKLLELGVFSSVFINHEEAPDNTHHLPLNIDVAEHKHRTINIGASYQTFFKFGLNFGWEHRNVGGMGQKLSVRGEITKRSKVGIASFLIPDFHVVGQDYTIQAEAANDDLFPYNSRSYNILNRFDKKIREKIQFSIGVRGERLYITDSGENGRFHLIETPLYFRYRTTKSILNPVSGNVLEYRVTPSIVVEPAHTPYVSQTASWSSYLPLLESDTIILAQKLSGGSILSKKRGSVPLSKRFFGGSEEEMRGYKYRSVSPIKEHSNGEGKPIGGRSFIYYTAEMRLRITEKFGFVSFFDVGRVTGDVFPALKGDWLKSAGGGLRYFSFMGPLRLDIGFPLDRRSIDPKYRIFVSIGQTF